MMDAEEWLKTIVDLLLVIIGVPGNLLVIIVYASKGTRISAHVFIIGLAIADIIVCFTRPLGVFNNIPQLQKYKHSSEIICRLPYFLKYLSMFSSVFITVAIAVDRYFAVCKPHGHIMTVRRAKIVLLSCLILCLFFSIPPLVIFGLVKYPYYGKVCSIGTPRWTVSLLYTPMYVVGSISVFVIIVMYSLIYLAIRNRIKVRSSVSETQATSSTMGSESNGDVPRVITMATSQDNEVNPHDQRSVPLWPRQPQKLKSKTTKMLFITTVVFVTTWIPFMVTMKMFPMDDLKQTNPVSYIFVVLVSKLMLINHAVNPFIYGLVSQKFRDDAKQTFSKIRMWFV